MKGFLMTLEALASLLVLLSVVFLISGAGGPHESRVSGLVVLMQTEDVAEFIAGSGGIGRVDEQELQAIAGELGACIRILVEEREEFRSECFEGSAEVVSVRYFELRKGGYAVARVEMEKE